jgi:S-adenosylmethionine synthetase
VQLAYAIGVADPISVLVDTQGSNKVDEAAISDAVRKVFPLTPSGIIKHLDLRKPIYLETASHGHFGRSGFSWESTEHAGKLRKAAGLKD